MSQKAPDQRDLAEQCGRRLLEVARGDALRSRIGISTLRPFDQRA
jgi:hypothetical protein